MKTRFGSIGIIVLTLVLLLTIGDIVLTYQNLVIAHENDKLVSDTYETNSELDKILIAITNVETGQRGYLITNDSSYLEPFNQSLPTIDNHINRLRDLTKNNPTIQKQIPLLRQLIQDRVIRLKQGIDFRNQQGYDVAQAFTEEGVGKQKMEQIRDLIMSFEADEKKLLAVRQNETENSYVTLFASSAFAGLLSILLILVTYFSLNREFAKRSELEKNKDEFFNMASHELKTPITSLNIFIHVLLKKINANQKNQAKKYVAKIESQTEKLTALISDFLDLARVQTGKMQYHAEEFNLGALIHETIDEIQGTTKKHKILAKVSSKEHILADRYRIYQVLVNLITNAIKYSPKGGKILITYQKEKDDVIVGVQDQGIGIEKKYQDKIFDRLYQVSSNPEQQTYPGFGIGLFVSKEIIRHHKGKIWVESEKGKGSTFFFSIPMKK